MLEGSKLYYSTLITSNRFEEAPSKAAAVVEALPTTDELPPETWMRLP